MLGVTTNNMFNGKTLGIAGNMPFVDGQPRFTDGRVVYGNRIYRKGADIISKKQNEGFLWLGNNVLYLVTYNLQNNKSEIKELLNVSGVDFVCSYNDMFYACISGKIYDMFTCKHVSNLASSFNYDSSSHPNCWDFSFDKEGNFYEALTVFETPNSAIIKKNGAVIKNIACKRSSPQQQFYSTVWCKYGKIYYRIIDSYGLVTETTGIKDNDGFYMDLGNHMMYVTWKKPETQENLYFDRYFYIKDIKYEGYRNTVTEEEKRVEFINDFRHNIYVMNVTGNITNNSYAVYSEALRVFNSDTKEDKILIHSAIDNVNQKNYGVGYIHNVKKIVDNFRSLLNK